MRKVFLFAVMLAAFFSGISETFAQEPPPPPPLQTYCMSDDSGSKFIFYEEFKENGYTMTRYRESKLNGVVGNLGTTVYAGWQEFRAALDARRNDPDWDESSGSCDLD